jgi:hypothetical protein
MAAREGPERMRPGEKPGEEPKAAIQKARSEAEAALARAKDEEKARIRAEKALAEAKEALAAARVKLEEEHLARAKAERASTEAATALAEARKFIGLDIEDQRAPSASAQPREAEQRISFIVRLTVDDRGQALRTEVEHAHTGRKETFRALDVQRLAAFMGMYTKPAVTPESITPPLPLPVTQETPIRRFFGSAEGLIVSDVRAFHRGLGSTALMINPGEAFVVQARFQFHGPRTPSFPAQGTSFDMRVYAREVTSGTSTLLATCTEDLGADVPEHTPRVQAPGLPLGLYRLVTVITLHAPTKMVAHYDGPIVHVFENQPSTSPALPPHGSLPE